MVGLPQFRGRPANGAPGISELTRLIGGPAFLALVAPGALIPAFLAAALHVPIGKELTAFGAIILQCALPVEIAVLHQLVEDVVDHIEMVLRRGLCEQGEVDAQVLDGLLVDAMVALGHLLRSGLLLLGPDGDGRSMHVRAGDHEDLISLERVIFCEYVRGQEGTGHMSEMKRAVGVGPSNADQYFYHNIEGQNVRTSI